MWCLSRLHDEQSPFEGTKLSGLLKVPMLKRRYEEVAVGMESSATFQQRVGSLPCSEPFISLLAQACALSVCR